MKRAIWIGVLAVLAFAVILLVRLPASWLSGALPPGVACGQISGTLWNGTCSTLAVRNIAIGDLNWRLHAMSLLGGKLRSQVEVTGSGGSATAEVELRSGNRLEAHDLRADFALDPALLPHAPPNLRGHVRTGLAQLRFENGRVTALEGRIDVHDLKQRGSQNLTLGDFVLTFPATAAPTSADEPVGEVRSIKGTFAVEATLRLTREPGFVLEGLIAAGVDTPPEILQSLNYLGSPDSQGRRPFSIAGTF